MSKYIGMSFETGKGSTLTVESRLESGILLLSCSRCSKDSELFPNLFRSYPQNLKAGHIPCGCAKAPRWSEKQWIVKIERACKEYGYTFLGWGETFRGRGTLTRLMDNNTGLEWESTSARSIVNKKIYPPSRKNAGKYSTLKSDAEHIDNFMATGSFTSGTEFSRCDDMKNWIVTCPLCAIDDYAINGGCRSKFKCSHTQLSKGLKPCRCSDNHKRDRLESEFIVKRELRGRGSNGFIGWDGGYQSSRSIVKWSCSKNHECKTNIRSLIHGKSGCPICSSSGFKKNKTSVLYAGFWDTQDGTFIKYGITNDLSISTRVNSQKRGTDSKLIMAFKSDEISGFSAYAAELEIKEMFSESTKCSKEVMRDGFTETVIDSSINRSLLFDKLKSIGINMKLIERYGNELG